MPLTPPNMIFRCSSFALNFSVHYVTLICLKDGLIPALCGLQKWWNEDGEETGAQVCSFIDITLWLVVHENLPSLFLVATGRGIPLPLPKCASALP